MEGGVLGLTSFTTLWPQNVQLFFADNKWVKTMACKRKRISSCHLHTLSYYLEPRVLTLISVFLPTEVYRLFTAPYFPK